MSALVAGIGGVVLIKFIIMKTCPRNFYELIGHVLPEWG